MKSSPKALTALLFVSLIPNASAVLVYRIDAAANTLIISGDATGTATNGGVEWIFETGISGDSASEPSLLSGSISPSVETLFFSSGGVTDALLIGRESSGSLTFVANEATYSYDALPASVETFVETQLMGNDILLLGGSGFGNIVYVPEPSTIGLMGLAMLGFTRRKR